MFSRFLILKKIELKFFQVEQGEVQAWRGFIIYFIFFLVIGCLDVVELEIKFCFIFFLVGFCFDLLFYRALSIFQSVYVSVYVRVCILESKEMFLILIVIIGIGEVRKNINYLKICFGCINVMLYFMCIVFIFV